MITAMSPGSVTIWIEVSKFDLVETAAFTLTVEGPIAKNVIITLMPDNNTISCGESFIFKASVYPLNVINKDVIWLSENEEILSVVNPYSGEFKALSPGTAKIKAISVQNPSAFAELSLNIIKFSKNITDIYQPTYICDSILKASNDYAQWPASVESICYGMSYETRMNYLQDTVIAVNAMIGTAPFLHYAASMLLHFLDNSGSTYYFDFSNMNNNWNIAYNNRINDINQTLSAAELLAEEEKSITFCSTSETQHQASEFNDWGLSIGKYSTNIKCTVSKNGNYFNATIYYYLHDYYDYDNTDNEMGLLPVSPKEMWELHHGGIAKFFEIMGVNTLQIEWVLGQRYNTGAIIQEIN